MVSPSWRVLGDKRSTRHSMGEEDEAAEQGGAGAEARMVADAAGGDAAKRRRKKRVLASYQDVRRALEGMSLETTSGMSGADLQHALKALGIAMSREDFALLLQDHTTNTNRRSPVGPAAAGGVMLPKISIGKAVAERQELFRGGPVKPPNTETRKLISRAPKINVGLRQKLEAGMKKHWMRLNREFRKCDVERTGLIGVPQLLRVLSKSGIELSSDEVDLLYVQHGHGESAQMWYMDFLKNFMSSVKYQAVVEENKHTHAHTPPAHAAAKSGRKSAPPDLPLQGAAGGSKPGSQRGALSVSGGASSAGGGWGGRGDAPLTAQSGERQRFLRELAQCWRSVRQACKALDKDNAKLLKREQVKTLLLRLGHTAKPSVLDEVLDPFYTDHGMIDYNRLIQFACRMHLPTL